MLRYIHTAMQEIAAYDDFVGGELDSIVALEDELRLRASLRLG